MSDGSNNNFLDSLDTQFIENLDTDNDVAVDAIPDSADVLSSDVTPEDNESLFEIIHQPDAIEPGFNTAVYQDAQSIYDAPVGENQTVEESENDAQTQTEETFTVAEAPDYAENVASEETVAAEEVVADENTAPAGDSAGKKVGRIIVSILLGITVAVFVFGCYTAAFLDKNAVYVFGHSFASVKTDADAFGLSKGDLLIIKRTESADYQTNDLIVTKADALSGEYLQRVESVGTDSFTGEAKITASTTFMGVKQTHELSTDYIVGVCKVYIPVFAGVINFAIANWIYVYILFALLLSFWILLLVLFKKKKN